MTEGPAPDMDEMTAMLLDHAMVEQMAATRYNDSESQQNSQRARYERNHWYYLPPDLKRDQWPEDVRERPGKIHVTANVVKPVVDVSARLQSIPPRISIPASVAKTERVRAEAAEELVKTWLELSGWEVWLGTLCKTKAIYGKGVLKPFWNEDEKRADVIVVENPANLRVGWGSSDFSVIDWCIYEYSLSPAEASRRFDIELSPGYQRGEPVWTVHNRGLQSDPLDQKGPVSTSGSSGYSTVPAENISRVTGRDLSEYERKHVRVWDYWYLHPDDGKVCNAILVEGRIVVGPVVHDEMPDIPYIIIENDHEPGTPEGVSDVEVIVGLQYELNRLLSHAYQDVADNVDPAYVVEGEAGVIPEGFIPKAGEAQGVQGKVYNINQGASTFPYTELVRTTLDVLWVQSGMSPLQMGQMPSSDISGRALAIQIEAAINRLDPKRRLLYRGLVRLVLFWLHMVQRLSDAQRRFPAGADPQTGETITGDLGEVVKGFTRWRIIAPEITPRDMREHTLNEIDKVNARLSSIAESMDQVGVDSPEAMLDMIRSENSDLQLRPDVVQGILAVYAQMLQLQQSMAVLQQQMGQMQQGIQQGVGNPLQQGQQAVNNQQQAQYAAQPGGRTDENQPGGQPMTQATTGAPGNGQGPKVQSLIRGGRALTQIRV